MSQPILDLDAELRQLEVKYQGSAYALRSRSELSILELRELSSMLHEYDALASVDDGDEENAVKIGQSLQKIAATLLKDDPPAGGFPEQMCGAILSFWTEHHKEEPPPPVRPRRAPQDRRPSQKRRSTGAK